MRLINVDEFCRSENLVLEYFIGDKTPKYAILSHTWSDGEVSFSHLDSRATYIHRAGFVKISFACRQANRDGYHWLWVDTCCIDKTSSSELSEAINSMYQWYEGSEICYVHLEDLPSNCPRMREIVSDACHSFTGVELVTTQDRGSLPSTERLQRRRSLLGDLNGIGRLEEPLKAPEQLQPQYWINALAECRWFTRGWTLQELIAPLEVAFFGSDWNPIAYKRHILHTISGITGIDTLVLTKQISLEELSVAKKMSWAAGRETTRKEDESYCLLGILGINMTLLYGEGEKAFTRIQEEVLRVSTDCSVFLWPRGRHARLDSRKARALRQPPDTSRVLLAPNTAAFKPCSKITHEKRSEYECSYTMTHRGLQLEIVLMPFNNDEAHEEYLGIMPCHLEDDFKHSLAIHLRKHQTSSNKEPLYSIERCRRECSKDLSRHGMQHFHSVRVEDRPAQAYTKVLIPRDNFQSAMTMSALEWTSSVWVRTVPADFQFKQAYPQHQWNAFTLTWNRYKSLSRESTSRAAGLSFTYCGTEIMISFEVYLDTGVILTMVHEKQDLPHVCEHVSELCNATNQLESSVFFSTVTGPDEELEVVSRLSHQSILSERVWIIDLELRRTEFNFTLG